MRKAIADLFSSKKFLVMLATIIAYVASRIGWDIDADKFLPALGIVASWLVSQGITDHGKGAATATPPLPPGGEIKPPGPEVAG